MKTTLIILLLSLLYVPSSFAIKTLPKEVQYYPLLPSAQGVYPAFFDKIMTSQGFHNIKLRGSQFTNKNPSSWLDRIYYTKTGFDKGGYILTRSNLLLVGPVNDGEIYKIESGYLVHFNLPDYRSMVVYFQKINKGTIDYLAKKIRKSIPKHASYETNLNQRTLAFLKSVQVGINTAHAEEAVNYFCSKQKPDKNIRTMAFDLLKNGGPCLKDIGAGLWSATGGTAGDIGKGFWRNVTNPGDTLVWKALTDPREILIRIGKQIYSFQMFYGNFLESMGEFKHQIMALPTEVKWKILCELTGNLGAGVVISALTTGTGSVVLLRNVSLILEKLSKTMGSDSLRRTALKMNAKAERTKQILTARKSAKADGKSVGDHQKALKANFQRTGKKLDALTKRISALEARDPRWPTRKTENLIEKLKENSKHFDITQGWATKYLNKMNHQLVNLQRTLMLFPADQVKIQKIVTLHRELERKLSRGGYKTQELKKEYEVVSAKLRDFISKVKKDGIYLMPGEKAWLTAEEIKKLPELRKEAAKLAKIQDKTREQISGSGFWVADASDKIKKRKVAIGAGTIGISTCRGIENVNSAISNDQRQQAQPAELAK